MLPSISTVHEQSGNTLPQGALLGEGVSWPTKILHSQGGGAGLKVTMQNRDSQGGSYFFVRGEIL